MIYLESISSLSDQAYAKIRRMIVRLELPPGTAVREDDLQRRLGIGRTPIREALQRLARDQFVTVIPRRGMLVTSIDVAELALLHETRAVMEPYAARLACARGRPEHWASMAALLDGSPRRGTSPVITPSRLLDIDRGCHEIVWAAADNRFLTATLDMLYAQSDRLWHLYLADVAGMVLTDAVDEHADILDALRIGDADRAADLVEAHVRSFEAQVSDAIARRLAPSVM